MLVAVLGIIALTFNKDSGKLKKIIIISSSVLPIAFSAIYPLVLGIF